MSTLPLSERICVVTGASRGIGFEAALALGKAGAQIVAIARTQGGLEELDASLRTAGAERATLVPMDLSDGDGLDHLGGALHQRFGRIDLLIHAGAMLGSLTPVAHIDPKQWERVVAVNLGSTYRLIRSFEPLLKASDAGRAIFVTSGVASRPRAFWGAYAATKAGMEAMVRSWADEVENTKVRAIILDPGRVRTRMRAEAFPADDPMTLPHPSELGPLFVELAEGDPGLPARNVIFSEWAAARSRVQS
jgi:NAD(P)-dependent dehydrogenase (short-subunit alcohol dehydrogenase family)